MLSLLNASMMLCWPPVRPGNVVKGKVRKLSSLVTICSSFGTLPMSLTCKIVYFFCLWWALRYSSWPALSKVFLCSRQKNERKNGNKQTNKNWSRLKGHRAPIKPFSSPQAQKESFAIGLRSGLMCCFSKMSYYGRIPHKNIHTTYAYTIQHSTPYTNST